VKVIPFQTGPILGATDGSSARIFGRGEPQLVNGQSRMAHAVIRLCGAGGGDALPPRFFKLNPNFDMSAVCVLTGLVPGRPYHYQAGYFFLELETEALDTATLERHLDWSDVAVVPFQSATTSQGALTTVAFGSCRYARRKVAPATFDDRGDKTFRSILDLHLKGPLKLDALLMCGDQIYADGLAFVSPDTSFEEFLSHYRDVFSQPHIKQLMSQVPTYMTLDDHEIENDWPAKATSKDVVTKLQAALNAYRIYQMSHSPLHPLSNGRIASPPDRLWYTFSIGDCDFFMSDSRTERRLDDGPRTMISQSQLDALLAWLGDGSGRVKVFVTSVPFWEATSDDKWHGFREQRDAILEHIRINRIRRVLILAGDVHASLSSELRLASDPAFRIVSVVSSPFFWPPPLDLFKLKFQISGPIPTGTGTPYEIVNASKVVSADNFTILRIQFDRVGVDVYGRKGELLDSTTHFFGP